MTQYKFGIIVSPTYRSRAYLQSLKHTKLYPSVVLKLPGAEPIWNGLDELEIPLGSHENFVFKPNEAIDQTLSFMKTKIINLDMPDINNPHTHEQLSKQEEKIFVYSGLPGVILRPPIFRIGKKFLHVHGGEAPEYSGSTAFYYSLLQEDRIGVTAIWMNEGIDTGATIERSIYPVPYGINIDNIYDPVIRAHLLSKVLKKIVEGSTVSKAQDESKRVTYYVIHPILKHIVLRKCGLIKGVTPLSS